MKGFGTIETTSSCRYKVEALSSPTLEIRLEICDYEMNWESAKVKIIIIGIIGFSDVVDFIIYFFIVGFVEFGIIWL